MKIPLIIDLIKAELQADRVWDDVTGQLLDPSDNIPAIAAVLSRQNGIYCGDALISSFAQVLAPIKFHAIKVDGDAIQSGETVLTLESDARTCLSIERTLLNFLALSCAVATETAHYVSAVKEYGVTILPTRKTLPMLREIQLLAVKAGGGQVHRRSLSDGILIKDNHIHLSSIKSLLDRATRQRSPLHRVEIEVESLVQLAEVLSQPLPDIIMLDNMSPSDARQAIEMIGGKCKIEISGGINLDTIRSFAQLRPDYISVGALTHSIQSFDLCMEFT